MSKQDFSEKTCFIITPVGSPESSIRRKANGIIDSVILPVLTEELSFKKENINIPHKTYSTGSITKQVIESILNDDLAIANLTGLNPNVMYELAVRHAARLPVVSIMESNTDLPFDISDERTIFYEDDIAEVTVLKENFKKMVLSAISDNNPDNPIYRVIREDLLEKDIEVGSKEEYILNRLDKLEKLIIDSKSINFSGGYSSIVFKNKIRVKIVDELNESEFSSFLKEVGNIFPGKITLSNMSRNKQEFEILVEKGITIFEVMEKVKMIAEKSDMNIKIGVN